MSSEPNATSSSPRPSTPELRSHTYDGIQEFDQKLPNWWLFTLYITIVFGALYWLYHFQLDWGKTDADRVSAQVSDVFMVQKRATQAALGEVTDDVLWAQVNNPATVRRGKDVFAKICWTCHGQDLTAKMGGAQLPGVSLVDATWKYSNKPLGIMQSINTGTPDPVANMKKGEQVMPAKGGIQLDSEQLKDVTVYIMSFNQRGPDGTVIPK